MTLTDLYESRFRGDVRFRGDAYLKAERVSLVRVTADAVFGVVRDGVDYHTQLARVADQLKMYCDCAAGPGQEPACKHLWATLRAVDEGRLLTASPKPGYVPPFAVAGPKTSSLTGAWGVDEDDDDFDRPASGAARAPRAAAVVQEELRPWEASLQAVREKIDADEPPVPAGSREQEVFYEIDVAESAQCGRLVVQVSQRQRRANGQWGKFKPLKIRPDRLHEVEREEDRRILAYLLGGIPERTNWYAQQAETQSLVHRFRVHYELAEMLLPLMCRTERVRYLEDSEKVRQGLTWDEGPPWELTLRVRRGAESGWLLEAALLRGDEELPPEQIRGLVPGGLVLEEHGIARLDDFGAFPWSKLVKQTDPPKIVDGEEHEFVDRLLDVPALPRLELPDAMRLEHVECVPVPRLSIRTPRAARWRFDRLQGEVTFDYLGTVVGAGSGQWAVVQRAAGRCVLRNQEAEQQAWSRLLSRGFRRVVDRRRGQDVDIPARELGTAVRGLIAEGWEIRADGHQVRQPAELRFKVTSNIDWFELRADVDFEGRSVAFPELLAALARGDGTIRLDDGSLGILPEDWLQKYGLLAGLGVTDGDHLRFGRSQLSLLDALLAAQPSVDYDVRFLDLRAKLESFDGVKATAEPESFVGELREYQREGLGWLEFLQSFGFGGCLADDMGLGKTIQFLALLLDRVRTRKETRPSLVVVPKSLMFNWAQECAKFAPALRVVQYAGMERAALRPEFARADLILTTYGTLRRDVLELKDVPFDYVVLDEAQTIKNSGSQIAKASRLLRAENRLALSGTPIENHLGDLWSIFEFLNPGMLGRSSAFKLFAADARNEPHRQALARGLRPFILRRTKQQVASELPEKTEQTILCDMRREQSRLYAELREHYRQSLLGMIDKQGLNRSKMHVLEALLRLRQAACHPALLDRSTDAESSAKLDVLLPHLQEIVAEGHKALVFSQFTSMLAIVRKHLEKHGIVHEYLDGQTRDRKQRVERFQTDEACPVFLVSLKAGGLGLNLTAADYVFLLDPWWNPAVEAQAIDRAHRVGQTRQVMAYRLICRGTVEEKIAELQEKKRALADAILEADGSLLESLSQEDLELLLS